MPSTGNAFAYFKADTTTAVTLAALKTTAGITDGHRVAMIVPEGVQARWRSDGTAPTSTVGMPIAVGAAFIFTGDADAFKIIGGDVSIALFR